MKLPNNMSTTTSKKSTLQEEYTELNLGKPSNYCYLFDEFDNDKKLTNYIKSIERAVRSSIEYRNYIRYLKEEQDLTQCAFFKKIDIKTLKKVSIEFHHYPFNLYEIVDTVLAKQTNLYQNPVSFFDVANEVTRIHYENMVGLVPLSKTLHELAHDGELFINFNLVYGNVEKFIDDYREYINPDLMEAITRLNILSDKNSNQSNNFILKKKFQRVILDGREIKPYISSNKEVKLA